jgi:hypothetical protein
MWFICTMEYYSAIKKEDILTFAGKWMELANILSEVTQTQKNMHGMYSLISWYYTHTHTHTHTHTNIQNTQDTVHRIIKVQQAELPKWQCLSLTWEREERNHKCGGREGQREDWETWEGMSTESCGSEVWERGTWSGIGWGKGLKPWKGQPQEIAGWLTPPPPEYTIDLECEKLLRLKRRDLRWNTRQ